MDKHIKLKVISSGKEKELSFEHAEKLLNFEANKKKPLHQLIDEKLIFKDGKIINKPNSGANRKSAKSE